MATGVRALLAGETWVTHTLHMKGFDSFTETTLGEGYTPLKEALESRGHQVDVMENHRAPDEFPWTVNELTAYDVVLLSDIGANTLLLPSATFHHGQRRPDRLAVLADWVRGGGGLVMIGGYLTFGGIEGKGRWHGTPVEGVLPVEVKDGDDRVERPDGAVPTTVVSEILEGIPEGWPHLLGYNRLTARPGATVVATIGDDPLLVVGTAEQGRAVAFASDCSPHWAPPDFLDWEGYPALWDVIVRYVAQVE
jgi:uncharacterized membrane protein